MSETADAKNNISLSTGTLALTVKNGPPLAELCDFAARANPKRGFLIVSKILGRHLPARPQAMRRSMNDLAAKLPVDLPEPIVFLGMAETATALGQGVFAGFRLLHPAAEAIYLQTSRQEVAGAAVVATFEEGHSHATTHLVQVAHDELMARMREARSLVIIDDECSTGNTFIGGAEAMLSVLPMVERIETCCITDWSGKDYYASMPLPTSGHAILDGAMSWTPKPDAQMTPLASGANKHGAAPEMGMESRSGLTDPETAHRSEIGVTPGERILVLGDGEHSYEALLIAEEIEAKGGVAAVQSITRSPALKGHAMQSISLFEDAYGSGAQCYLYNILAHSPERVIIAAELEHNQADLARKSLQQLGSNIPVEVALCTYGNGANR